MESVLVVRQLRRQRPPHQRRAPAAEAAVVALPEQARVGLPARIGAETLHKYLGPPDVLHPTNDVPVRLTVLDDDAGLAFAEGGFFSS